MTSKKNVSIAVLVVLLKKENETDDNDINAKIAIENIRIKNNYQDLKQNCGTSMSGKNKLFQI